MMSDGWIVVDRDCSILLVQTRVSVWKISEKRDGKGKMQRGQTEGIQEEGGRREGERESRK